MLAVIYLSPLQFSVCTSLLVWTRSSCMRVKFGFWRGTGSTWWPYLHAHHRAFLMCGPFKAGEGEGGEYLPAQQAAHTGHLQGALCSSSRG